MTILPKQKAAGPAPKKSVVNRDGNHSRDVAHYRQGVPGASAADRGWGPTGHGSASSSAWPSGVGPPAPGPSSSRGWGTAAGNNRPIIYYKVAIDKKRPSLSISNKKCLV